MNSNTKISEEDIVLEVYLKLILDYHSKGKDATNLKERYIELLNRKK